MEQRTLGRTGTPVPVVGMGTWQTFDVGGAADRARCAAIVAECLDGGATVFDTSPMYGAAEEVLGAALGGRRSEAFVATKVWTDDDDAARSQYRNALEWYGGYIDLYQVHNLVRWPQRLDELERLRAEGRVRFIGATHYRQDMMPELARVIRIGRIDAVQVPYNAVTPEVEQSILPLCAELGVGVLVMRPLGAGAVVKRPPPPEALAPLHAYGVTTWAQALLKWVLSDPRVHVTIPATRRPGRMTENIGAGRPPWLPDDARAYVTELARRYA